MSIQPVDNHVRKASENLFVEKVQPNTIFTNGQSSVDADLSTFESEELRNFRKTMVWFSWGMSTISGGDPEDGIPRITGAEIAQAQKNFKRGDIILCGNSGGLSHVALYMGEGKIIHAMATSENQRGLKNRILDALQAVQDFKKTAKPEEVETLQKKFKQVTEDAFQNTSLPIRNEVQKMYRYLEQLIMSQSDELDSAFATQNLEGTIENILTELSDAEVFQTLIRPISLLATYGILPNQSEKTGVFQESLSDFFDRYPRDTYITLRKESLRKNQLDRGEQKVAELIGKPYDYDLLPENDAFYCTEIALEFLKAAAPRTQMMFPSTQTQVYVLGNRILEREAVIDPTDLLRSGEFKIIAASKSAAKNFSQYL